ncbi:hypothetical protein DLM78_00160 [Leptospira stimsonii]|uniref:Uncharacterized protein n=1 Tax=Leptospira stimsonii TaxID=2202203 RepID=A0A8B3CT73_9LEPT|nr:hypothetical protein DLM78_00160 [Leptospira stimsonii]
MNKRSESFEFLFKKIICTHSLRFIGKNLGTPFAETQHKGWNPSEARTIAQIVLAHRILEFLKELFPQPSYTF